MTMRGTQYEVRLSLLVPEGECFAESMDFLLNCCKKYFRRFGTDLIPEVLLVREATDEDAGTGQDVEVGEGVEIGGAEVADGSESLGARMCHYVRERAKVEGVGFGMSVGFFEEAIERQFRPIFGVHHDGLEMLWDDQEPYAGFFEQKAPRRPTPTKTPPATAVGPDPRTEIARQIGREGPG